jgi:predicted house-cleaning noncanonical NTP pyrophosphatase (MazG superfamily)
VICARWWFGVVSKSYSFSAASIPTIKKIPKISLGLPDFFSYSPYIVSVERQNIIYFPKVPMLLAFRPSKTTTQILVGIVLAVFMVSGCQTSGSGKRSFFPPKSDNIPGILQPSKRIKMIRLKAENGRKSDLETKKELLEQFLEEYAHSPDSIVRQEVVTAVATLVTSSQENVSSDMTLNQGFDLIKYAAMRDEDPFVRREACRVIASWQRQDSAVVLRHVVRNDRDKDVQLQAAQSLAAFDDTDTRETLGSLLDHRQPALRYQAMQSLKVSTKQDFGNDVRRWKQYLNGEIPDPIHTPTLAERFRIGQLPMIY